MNIDFTIVEGKGPKIVNPIKTMADVENVKPLYDVDSQVPFLGPILKVQSNTDNFNNFPVMI